MGKSSSSPPAAPDPVTISNQQTASDEQTALYQSQLNNGNSSGPYGSVTNTYDPTTNQWSQNTSLSPQEQTLFNEGTQAEGTAVGLGQGDLTNNVAPALSQRLTAPQMQTQVGNQPIGQQVDNAINANYQGQMQLLEPQMQQASEHQQAGLVAQGLNPNDAAYQNSQTLFNNGQATELGQVATNAVNAGNAEENTLFGQELNQGQFNNSALQSDFANTAQAQEMPINEFDALMSGGQVTAPTVGQFAQTGVSPTNVEGAYGLSDQMQMYDYGQQMQNQQSTLGGLFNLGTAAMSMFSDSRLKRLLRHVGYHLGIPVYDFVYHGDNTLRRGVVAQDVLKVRPNAVSRHPSGYLMVNYGALV